MSDRADDLVAFFASLPPSARREYEALVELDRRFGEDVEAERRVRGGGEPPSRAEKPS